jgi:4-hydroxybenzoate polyprenyltransferase/phosphoserine phosphatase
MPSTLGKKCTVKPPLVVDLDGTLTPSDSLVEALVYVALRRPQELFQLLAALGRGRFALKAFLADLGAYHAELLPVRADLVAFIKSERASGRPVYLVTAAHQSVANAIGDRLGLFDAVIGSSDGVNLKAKTKGDRIDSLLPGGFAYAGNDNADLAVWSLAQSIVLVNASSSVTRKARALGKPIEEEFHATPVGVKTWLRALRVHQWAKNVLLFVPLFLAHRYADATAWLRVAIGFFAFSIIASATYLINDLSDLAADRLHKTKRNRPLARGDITIPGAVGMAALLGAAGLVCGYLLDARFAGLLIVYIILTLSYSLRLKAIALLDVFVLGMLYSLRIFMGGLLIDTVTVHFLSPWLFVFSLFFFYSLSMAKRHSEIESALTAGSTGRVRGRGYLVSDGPFTLAIGMAASVAAVVVLFQWVASEAFPAGFYPSPAFLWALPFLVFMWSTRVWLKSHRGRLHDDPVLFALKDKPSLVLAALMICCFGLASR